MPFDCPLAGKKHVLYVCFGYQIPKGAKLIEDIKYKDGLPAINLIEFTGEINFQKLPERLEYFKEGDVRFPGGIIPNNYPSFWPIGN